MAIVQLPSATGAKTLPEVIDVVENMRKTVEFLLTNVDSDNVTSLDSSKTNVSALILDTLNLKDLTVTSAKIGLLEVKEANIALLAVTEAKIANLAVTTAKIADAAITNAKIDRATVDKLVVTTADIGNLAVTNAKIDNLSVTTAKIADAAITNAKIDLASVNKLVVQTANIADLSVTTAKIATAAIGTTQIADASITDLKVVTVSANKLTAGTIDAALITVKNLVADNIVTGTITLASANLFENTQWKTDTSKWSLGTNVSLDTTITNAGTYSIKTIQSGLAADGWRGISYQDGLIKASEGEKFTASIYTLSDNISSIDRGASIEINFLNSGGTRIAGYVATNIKPTANGVWERFSQTATAPAGTVSVRIYAYVVRNGRLWLSRPMIVKGTLNSEWQPHTNELLADKGINNLHIGDSVIDNRVIQAETITGDKLVVRTITAAQIAANTITANEMVVGTITAASGILANASIVTATIADLAVTNAKISTLDAVKITTGTLDAARIGAISISAEKLAVGDFTNYATVSELIPATMAAVGSYGTSVIDTGYVKKSQLIDGYLMFCNYSPNPFQNGDVLYYEFYAKLVGTASKSVAVSCWGYKSDKAYNSVSNGVTITVTDTEQLFTGTIPLNNSKWSDGTTSFFLFGLGSLANTDVRVKLAKVYRKTHGKLIVDGSITANQIAAGSITADKLTINIGGRNMIKNSAFKGGSYTDWDTVNSTFEVVNSVDYIYGKGLRTVRNAGATTYGMYTPRFVMRANVTYSVSFIVESMWNAGPILDYVYLRHYVGGVITTVKQLPNIDTSKFLTIHGQVARWRVSFQVSHTADLLDARIMIARTDNGNLADQGFVVTELKIEEGDKSTSYSPAPEEIDAKLVNLGTYIDATGIYTGKISFDQGEGGVLKLGAAYGDGEIQVYDSGGTAIGRIDVDGAYFPKVQADTVTGNVVNTYKPYTNDLFYFDVTSGNDSNSGLTTALPKKSLQAFLNTLPKDLNGSTITLRCKGTLNDVLALNGFKNGKLQIVEFDASNKMTVKNGVWAYYCEKIFLQSIVIHGFGGNGNAMVHAFDCKDFHCYDVKLYAGPNQSHGFWMINTGFRFDGCHVYNITDRGLFASNNSRGYIQNCKGNPPVAVLSDLGATVSGFGTRWNGSLVGRDGGEVWAAASWTVDTGEAAPPTPTAPTEQTLTISPSTGDNWSTSGYWTNDEVKQGDWGYGARYGLWYMDLSAVNGKTIINATITVYRGNGGSSAGRTVHFRAHNYTSRGARPGGAPSMSTAYAKGTIAVGATATFDITDLVNAQIKTGAYKSIGVYITGGTDYMSLGTTPTVSIRYS